MSLREEILERVAELLQSDSEPVQRSLRPVAQGLAVQFMSPLPPFDGHVLKHQALQRDCPRARREPLAQRLPIFLIEGKHRILSIVLELRFPAGKQSEKNVTNRVVRVTQMGYPLLHDLYVAQFAQAAEQSFRQFLLLFPSGIGINR